MVEVNFTTLVPTLLTLASNLLKSDITFKNNFRTNASKLTKELPTIDFYFEKSLC